MSSFSISGINVFIVPESLIIQVTLEGKGRVIVVNRLKATVGVLAGVGLLLALTDAAPLSAPAFSLVFPFLKMVLTEMPHHSEEEEERMAQILQILTVHAQLRASPSNPPGRVDEVGWGAQLPLGLSGVAGGGARASDTS